METFSMNSIAHTLSSHSEMIAPGVLGINFMKPEKPINTMSEVYKMVQEEQHNKGKSPHFTCTTPPLFRPTKIPPTVAPKPKADPAPVPAPTPAQTPAPKPQGPSQGPCSDCGRMIHGHFVSLQDKTLHEECFNCSTCGASLKNIGFHCINNKLYCDLHAKLAARVIASNATNSVAGFSPEPVQPAAPQPAPVPAPKPVQITVSKSLPTKPTTVPSSIPQYVPIPYGMSNLPQTPSSSGGLAFRSISPKPYKRISGEYHRVNAPSSPTPGSTSMTHPVYAPGSLPFEMKPYMPPDQSSSMLFSSLNESSSITEMCETSQITQKSTQQISQSTSQSQFYGDFKQQIMGGQQTKKFVWPPQKSPFELETPNPTYSPLATQGTPQPPEPVFPSVQPPEMQDTQPPVENCVSPMNNFVVPPLPTTFIAQPVQLEEPMEPVMPVEATPTPLPMAPVAAPPLPMTQMPEQLPQATNFVPVLPPVLDLPPTSAPLQPGVPAGAGSRPAPKKGRGQLMQEPTPGRIAICGDCGEPIRGPFIIALNRTWCPDHFHCNNLHCKTHLIDIGFVEEQGQLYCENCYEAFLAPICNKCNVRIKGDCLNALDRQWHPECFICGFCNRPFGNNSFYLEDGVPYCEKDWNELFTTKCVGCGFAIEAGDRWVEALNNNYHSQCFKCSKCQKNLEGQSFYAKGGKPFCKQHAR